MIEIRLIKGRTENVLTSFDAHNNVWEQYINLNSIMYGVRHSYSKSDTLIKYSKKKHSPVSSTPSDVLHLGTPKSYGDINTTGLVRDDSEGTFKETHNSNRRGIKQKLVVTYQLLDYYLLFCSSIDPVRNDKRQEQMRLTDTCYDFMTIIESPTSFAKQLGIDVRKQINIISTIVYHGPVIYLDDEDRVSEFTNRSRKKLSGIFPVTDHIPLFVKDKKYQIQQEYRFVVSTPLHRHSGDNLKLNVSDDLRKLMYPVQ